MKTIVSIIFYFIYYLLFVVLSIITLGSMDIELEFSNGKKLVRSGWISFIFKF